MANALHNIICLEAEWKYRNVKRDNFSLNTEPLLNWLRSFHGCDLRFSSRIPKAWLQLGSAGAGASTRRFQTRIGLPWPNVLGLSL